METHFKKLSSIDYKVSGFFYGNIQKDFELSQPNNSKNIFQEEKLSAAILKNISQILYVYIYKKTMHINF